MMDSQPIEVTKDPRRRGWVTKTFENDATGCRYVAILPNYGPPHFHRYCWCKPRVQTAASDIPLVTHREPPN